MRTRLNTKWLWVVPLLLLAGLLAARLLNADILFVDEYWSIRNAGGDRWGPLSPIGIWQQTATGDPGGMGVFYHYTLAAWFALVGDSVFALRLFSWIFGLLTIALLYRLADDRFGQRVALASVVVMAGSAFFMDYMHEGRAYTLLAFEVVLCVWLYLRLRDARRAPPIWQYGLLTLSIAALLYTHYIALAVGGFLGWLHVLRFRRTRRWRLLLTALVLGAVAFLPWVGITMGIIQRGSGEVTRHETSMQAGQVLEQLAHTFSNGNIALLLILLVMATGYRWRRSGFAWGWLIIVLLAIVIVNAVIPFMVHARYMLVLWPVLALLVALGIDRMASQRYLRNAILAIWLLIGIATTLTPDFIANVFGQIYRAPAAGFLEAIDLIDAQKRDGDFLLAHFMPYETTPFALFPKDYYFDPLGMPHEQPERIGMSFAQGDNDYLRDVEAALVDAHSIWRLTVLDVPETNHSGVVDYLLRTRYLQCGLMMQRDDATLALYETKSQEPAAIAYDAPEGDLGLTAARGPVVVDGELYLTLIWQLGEAVPAGQYHTSLQLIGPDGALATQFDYALPDQRPASCVSTILPVGELPAGDYDLFAIVYDAQTGDRLAQNGDDKALLESISLGE
ncbi:MAG: glycosyltransferase family 39 protein [Anaerolineae bacterium]|nr:glycosyltransferase family 39 protein [Anaerolineae bacterium]